VWIDSVDFPFTEGEVIEAVALWHSTRELYTIAAKVIAAKREWAKRRVENEPRVEAAARERVIFVYGSVSDDASHEKWFWPALSVLSETAADRVAKAMEIHWRERAEKLLCGECVTYARSMGLLPTPEEFQAAVGNEEKMRVLMFDLRRRMPRLPEPTDEMRRFVDESIEREKAEWRALADEARLRLGHRRAGRG
jgi:hypothetical protein